MTYERFQEADRMGRETAEGLMGKVEDLLSDGLADAGAHQLALRMLSTAEMLTRNQETRQKIQILRKDIRERYGDPDEERPSFGP